ncbi:hypothetical protein MX586_09090 [Carnobacterium divergens]|nr:hypothetical protein [Carnobacterium divergens]SBO18544.1 GGDEF motif membrane protein [Carnobacterium divergens]
MMKNNQLLSDLSLLGFLLLNFIVAIFVGMNPERFAQNIIFMNIAMILAIVTYFTTITMGLVLNLLFIFGQGSYALFLATTNSQSVSLNLYFWLVMTPLFSVMIYLFSYHTKELQAENHQLERKTRQLGTLDAETRLRTMTAYKEDALVFMSTSRRFNLPVSMVVIQVKYWNELQRMLDDEQISEVIKRVTRSTKEAIRDNDVLYVLDREHLTWGLLLFTDQDGSKIVTDRIKEFFEKSAREFSDLHTVDLVIQAGAAQFDKETIHTPYDFVEAAIKELEYDV